MSGAAPNENDEHGLYWPPAPEVPPEQMGEAETQLRYEDVSQDGHLMLEVLPQTIGDVVWKTILARHPAARTAHQGIFSILTRLVVEIGDGPLGVFRPLTSVGRFQLAHTVGEDGAVDRLLLNMWSESTAARGRTHDYKVSGERLVAGRVFAEHTFTRLFAPPGERKVTRLEVPGVPAVPPERWTLRPPEATMTLPAGAQPLEEALRPDAAPIAFGLGHTDSNQHVNSLCYPRLFQDAALRRFAELGLPTAVLGRRLEVAFRKPFFAGERARILLQAFRLGERLGAAGAFFPEGPEAPGGTVGNARPSCTVQLLF